MDDIELLKKNYELLQRTFAASLDIVFVKNLDLQYIAASDSFVQRMGLHSAREVLGKTDRDLVDQPELYEKYEEADRCVIEGKENIIDQMEELQCKNGDMQYMCTTKLLITDTKGNSLGVYGRVKDITAMVIAEQRYNQELEQLRSMTPEDCYYTVVDLNDWKIVERKLNPVYGKTPFQALTLSQLLEHVSSNMSAKTGDAYAFYSNFSYEYINNMFKRGKDYVVFEYIHQLWNGDHMWMRETVKFRINPTSGHLMVLMSGKNIEEKKQKELELHRAAEVDGLTGLLNRNKAMSEIDELLKNAGLNEKFSLFMIDIDDFKKVNDTCGHQAGDRLLINVAHVLKNSFRENDVVCRLGGDEFMIFMRCPDNSIVADKKAAKVLENVGYVCCEHEDLSISVSIGICDYPADGLTLNELYANADKALYSAKSKGKNRYCIYGH